MAPNLAAAGRTCIPTGICVKGQCALGPHTIVVRPKEDSKVQVVALTIRGFKLVVAHAVRVGVRRREERRERQEGRSHHMWNATEVRAIVRAVYENISAELCTFGGTVTLTCDRAFRKSKL